MGTHRGNYTWSPGTGWIKKADKEAYSYDNLGEGWILFVAVCRWFPDFLVDLCRSEDANYQLPLLHRINMRAKANYQYVDLTECRGAGKSYCSIGEELTEQVTWPGVTCLYTGPNLIQTASIGADTFRALQHDYPVLTNHFQTDTMGKGTFGVSTSFSSKFFIAANRGMNLHKAVAEEMAQEDGTPFDQNDYQQVVLPAVRLGYNINGRKSPAYIRFKQHSITSAGRRQSYAYENRCRHITMMQRGESAFVMDVPYDVLLLNQMRPVSWASSRKAELTPDQQARELCSIYTGTDSFPMVSDSTLSDCRSLLCMEDHSCLKDRDNLLNPEDVIYIVGYDVSYADSPINAKCALVVLKLTRQKEFLRRDKYMKQVVWVDDWAPVPNMEQAKKLKSVWNKYVFDGADTFLAIDAWQYGTAVIQSLLQDLGDGLPTLCSYNHDFLPGYEEPGALPVIYPIKAGGVGVSDPDTDMVRYAQTQFEYRNVQLLTPNWQSGIEAYKKLHRIKDDKADGFIYRPYRKTADLVGQIQNLKVIDAHEKRISQRIQRDSWSALKYALRVAQKLELERLVRRRNKSDYEELLQRYNNDPLAAAAGQGAAKNNRLITARTGGRMF